MEQNPSAHYLTAIALLAQSRNQPSLLLYDLTLEEISELIFLFGGTVIAPDPDESKTPFLQVQVQVGNCIITGSRLSRNVDLMLQKDAFGANKMTFLKGQQLTIIDNSYLVF